MNLKKIHYKIVHCSGSEDYHPIEALNQYHVVEEDKGHVPYGKGWESPHFPKYPIEFTLKLLDGDMNVSEIQILSHHFKVASRIEIYSSRDEGSLDALEFTKLG
jgi:centrosomal protein CEP104